MSTTKQRADAINKFVVDAKAAGVWSSIKAAAILAGWDSVAGALTPLVGSAPTNNGFIDSDLDAGIGLKGDGSSKYIDSNRDASDDPKNDYHVSLYSSAVTNNGAWYGVGAGNPGSTNGSVNYSNGNPNARSRNATTLVGSQVGFSGMYIVARSSSSGWSLRWNNETEAFSQSSQTTLARNMWVFARNEPSLEAYLDGHLAFYSIGTSVDLAALDTVVSQLMSDLRSIDEAGMDRDALAYIRAVESADGSYLETDVKQAVDRLFKGLKYDGLWDSIGASCLLCGPRTISGALVPIKVEYGPELVDIDNLPTPTITDGAGSSGAWDATSNTASNTAVGTGNSYPRFLFNLGLIAGRQYRVTGRISSTNMYRVNGINLSSSATSESFVANGSGLIASGGTFDVLTTASDGYLRITGDGRDLFDHTIESLSIREDRSTPTAEGGWTESDYDRATGMKGDGSSLYLDTNRAPVTIGGSDMHGAAYVQSAGTLPNTFFSAPNFYIRAEAADTYFRANLSNTKSFGQVVSAPTFVAISRLDSVTSTRANETSADVDTLAISESASNVTVLENSDARLAFYSLGSSLDLAKLDSRISQYVADIAAAIP